MRGKTAHARRLNEDSRHSEKSFGMGELQKRLTTGSYGQLKDCPLFESNFVQILKNGEVANRVTMAVAASTPALEVPDLMLLARPVEYPKEMCTCEHPEPQLAPREQLELTALMPLKFVKIFVHNEISHQFKVRLANGRTFYLQLLADPEKLDTIFGQWVHILYRIRFYNPDAPICYR